MFQFSRSLYRELGCLVVGDRHASEFENRQRFLNACEAAFKRLDEMKTELAKQNRDLAKLLQEMKVSEAELREQTAADMRWDKYAAARATDEALKQMFESEKVTASITRLPAWCAERARRCGLALTPG